MLTQPLSMFRWRPKQRRMVTDVWKNCSETSFIVQGKEMNVLFFYEKTDIDPGSKLKKKARIYKPDQVTTPEKLKDIVLYVRI